MRKIEFFDTTLRDGEQTVGVNFSIDEKVKIAKQLETWGIDVIEAGFPIASPNDFKCVQAISRNIHHARITGLARMTFKDIDACVKATADADHKQIHVFIATSPIHREAKLHMTKAQVIHEIDEKVRYARQFFDIVQFSPEDATRTEMPFLIESVQTAINAGATVINVPDTVGYSNPIEFGRIIKTLIDAIPNSENISFSAHCHNDLGMATANAIAAIENGANRVEGTINGIGERAGNTALEEVAAQLHVRQDYYQCTDSIKLSETKKISDMVCEYSAIPIPKNKAVIGPFAFSHESGIHQDGFLKNHQTYEILTPETVGMHHSQMPLGKLSGSHAVMARLQQMGYDIDRADMKTIFPRFKAVADHCDLVSDDALREIMTPTMIKEAN
ncbi:2-isopropylmalate synthase [Agrilactobacillus yilanensis]|uniref:2-isopropylmalate synthase n=1 Tax=Agrilactobacillus yilanensis TaxID=2485997 RepID=A0ABW4J6T6_9LACO|nr:2-isopropylmalate synthase [Agrilactobacillus yilanensis]